MEEAMWSDEDRARTGDLFEVHERTMEDIARCLAHSEGLMQSSREILRRSRGQRQRDPFVLPFRPPYASSEEQE